MRHPPTKRGSKVVNKNTRSKRHYSKFIAENKDNLRNITIELRKKISLNFYEFSEIIATKLLLFINSNFNDNKQYNVGIYWRLGSEVDTKPSISALIEHNFKVSILSSEKNGFKFRQWKQDSNINKNNLGYKINGPIIQSPDIIICPLVCFDDKCNRLGRGGGHYDRILENYPKSVKIGLAYSQQLVKTIYPEEHDIKMNAIITEKKIYLCK